MEQTLRWPQNGAYEMGLFATPQEKLDQQFLKACERDDLEKIGHFLLAGANINAVSKRGYSESADRHPGETALHIAVRNNRKDLAEYLIGKGCDLNAKDGYNSPSVYEAIRRGRGEIAGLLIAKGCELNNSDEYMLELAMDRRVEDVAVLLLQKGMTVKTTTTPLHHAARRGCFKVVKYLVEQGADVHALDNDAHKASMLAGAWHPGVAEFLYEKEREVKEQQAKAATLAETGWQRTEAHEILHVADKGEYRLTSIFNFSAGIYTQIARNLATNAESQSMRFFHEFEDDTLLREAADVLNSKGGTVPEGVISGSAFKKTISLK